MSYEYSDPSREALDHALPDVEVFQHPQDYQLGAVEDPHGTEHVIFGFYWAAGFPGCLWDSDPVGPFDTYAEALADAREGVSS